MDNVLILQRKLIALGDRLLCPIYLSGLLMAVVTECSIKYCRKGTGVP
jgi:hypothetical protein